MINDRKGIDLPISDMQDLFNKHLWTDFNTEYNHRVFANEKNGNVIPQVYLGKSNKKEYKDVRFDDRLDALCWFDVSNNTNSYNLGQITQEVGVFFAVNLGKLFPDITHRAVEESHLAVQQILKKRPTDWEITGITTNTPAYGDYFTDNLKAFNMQPWHVFRFECNVKYLLNC